MVEGLEMICFQIISNVGAARSSYIEAIQKEAAGEPVGGSLILVHAEDQLMSAESFKIIAEEMIANYRRIVELEKKLAD